MKNYIKAAVCYLLILAMLITLLPPQAYEASTAVRGVSGQESTNGIIGTANNPGTITGNSTSLQAQVTSGNTVSMEDAVSVEDAKIVMELVKRRTEYSKEYKLDNGLNLAVVYSEPVHYKENGNWKEIDNTLKAHGSGKSASYKNTAGAWQVELPQQMEADSVVSITKDGYVVSFAMAEELRLETEKELKSGVAVSAVTSAGKSKGKVHTFDYSKQKKATKHPEAVPDKLRARMSYSGVYESTDIIYDLDPYQLKESIVINEYNPSVYGYVYTLDTGKLVPVLNKDGSVELKTSKKGETIMTMPAPFMIDDAGEVCTDVAVTLEKTGETYTLTYTLPMDWMAEESRAWPVVLDPAVKPGTSTSNILDHFVAENYSTSKSHSYLYAGHHTTYGDMRTYIKFSEIPDFTASDIVKKAVLRLNCEEGSSGYTLIEAHQVTSSWTTGSITWAGQPSWDLTILDYCAVSGDGAYSWDITNAVYNWYLGSNNGVMIKGMESVEDGSSDNWKRFYSVDSGKSNKAAWPYLEITYETETGIEDYWDYSTTSAGRAGSGYVSNTQET